MDALAVVALLLPAVNWSAAVILVRLARIQPRIGALTERARTAVWLAICSTLVAAVAFARLFPGFLPREVITVALVVVLLGLSVPAAWWLFLWETDRLGDGE